MWRACPFYWFGYNRGNDKRRCLWMFFKEDTTYNDMRYDSMMQWLTEVRDGDDVVNRGGAKLTLEYIDHLMKQIKQLEDKNALKDEFLKKMKQKSMETK